MYIWVGRQIVPGRLWLHAGVASLALIAFGLAPEAGAADTPVTASIQPWMATWTASPQSYTPGPEAPLPHLAGRTIRERMRLTVGGDAVRVRISNEFGTRPLIIGSATIGLAEDAASVEQGSLQPLTFSGETSATIMPGAPLLSDPVSMELPPGSIVSVSLYTPQKKNLPVTLHMLGLSTAVITPPGDFTSKTTVPKATTTTTSVYVTALLVPRHPGQSVIVAFGDSDTDGNGAKVDSYGRWTDYFAERLAKAGLANQLAIVNEAISGNRVLRNFVDQSALARFDRDVLAVPGVRYVIVLEGSNDLGFPGLKMSGHSLPHSKTLPIADDIIRGYEQLIARAHSHGIKIYGGTLLPWKDNIRPYYTPAKDKIRQKINHWIRTSGAFDGVIDFAKALNDPEHPGHVIPRYLSGDNMHASNAGNKAMADAIPLSFFRQ